MIVTLADLIAIYCKVCPVCKEQKAVVYKQEKEVPKEVQKYTMYKCILCKYEFKIIDEDKKEE